MLLLEGFSVIKPDPGLLFWTSVIFLFLWFFLGRAAFRPIANALKKREDDIEGALRSAELARTEMKNLHAQHEDLLRQAREERAAMLKEAKDAKDRIIAEAKERADAEYKVKVESAVAEIKNREQEMLTTVKNQVGMMAVEIAEKIIRRDLKGSKEHEEFATRLVDEFKMN